MGFVFETEPFNMRSIHDHNPETDPAANPSVRVVLTHEDAIAWGKTMLGAAKAILMVEPALQPMIFAINIKNDMYVCPVDLADDNDKEQIRHIIPQIIKDTQATAVLFITEGWVRSAETREKTGEEIIQAMVITSDKASGVGVKFTRDEGNKPIFQDIIVADHMETRFLPKDVSTLPWHDLEVMRNSATC